MNRGGSKEKERRKRGAFLTAQNFLLSPLSLSLIKQETFYNKFEVHFPSFIPVI